MKAYNRRHVRKGKDLFLLFFLFVLHPINHDGHLGANSYARTVVSSGSSKTRLV